MIWNEFIVLLRDNEVTMPRFPIWTDCWDNVIDDDMYKKYKSNIDKNIAFYNTNKASLTYWLMMARKNTHWNGALRKMEYQVKDNNYALLSESLWCTRASGIRVKALDYTPTLVAMTSMIPIVGPLGRYMTPRECARLQSFPDTYILDENDKVAYKQLGNAVNVHVIERCVDFLVNDVPLFN